MRWVRKGTLIAFRLLPGWFSKWAVFWLKRKYVIGVVAVVVDEDGRFLFLHHTYRKKRAWRLPGGLKERRENILTTVVREMKEEAGLVVRPLQILAVESADITLDVVVLCEVVEDQLFVANDEIDDLCWLVPEDADFAISQDQWQFIAAARTALHRLRRD